MSLGPLVSLCVELCMHVSGTTSVDLCGAVHACLCGTTSVALCGAVHACLCGILNVSATPGHTVMSTSSPWAISFLGGCAWTRLGLDAASAVPWLSRNSPSLPLTGIGVLFLCVRSLLCRVNISPHASACLSPLRNHLLQTRM